MPKDNWNDGQYVIFEKMLELFPGHKRMLGEKTPAEFYNSLEISEKNALGLMTNLAVYLLVDHQHSSSYEDQLQVIKRDSNRKHDRNFLVYSIRTAETLEGMRRNSDIYFWLYVSQANLTPTDRALDEYGVDYIVRDTAGIKLLQSGTRQGNVRDKRRELEAFYSKYMRESSIIGVFGVLDRDKNLLSTDELSAKIKHCLNETMPVVPARDTRWT